MLDNIDPDKIEEDLEKHRAQVKTAKPGKLFWVFILVVIALGVVVFTLLGLWHTLPKDTKLWGAVGILVFAAGWVFYNRVRKHWNVFGVLLMLTGVVLIIFKAAIIPSGLATPTPTASTQVAETPIPGQVVFRDGGFTGNGLDKFTRPCNGNIQTKNSQLNVIENKDYFDDTWCIISPRPEIVADGCSSCALQDYVISNASMTIFPTSFGPSANTSSTPAFGFLIQCDDGDELPDYTILINKQSDQYSAKYYHWIDQSKPPKEAVFIGQVKADGIKDLTLSMVMNYSSIRDPESKNPLVPIEVTFEDQVNSTLIICAYPKSISFGPWVDSKNGVYDSLDILVDKVEYTGIPKATPVP